MAVSASHPAIPNKAAKGISYYTPAQDPASGVAKKQDGVSIPKLFQPLKIRNLTFQNRIFVSPMCQYSAEDGHFTDWHMAHIGGIVSRGPGLTMIEATSVTAQGRITPEDSGIWKDSQIAPLKRVVEFAHSQNQHIGIQLAHAGRKASTVAPWLSSGATATEEVNGWPNDVWAPSAIPYSDAFPKPHALTLKDIEEVKSAYVAATKRALAAGFDVIEIHSAHGYLLHEFLSPVSNKRTDQYGGSWENRTRLALEVVDLIRSIIPETMPLFYRISATDWLDSNLEFGQDSWKESDTVRLAPLLVEHGVDFLDVSSGGNHPAQKITAHGPGYQASFAYAVKKAVGDKLFVGTVGSITTGQQAEKLLTENGGLDAVFVGRQFQKNPGLVWTFAEETGVDIHVARQIEWGFAGRGTGGAKKKESKA